MATSGQVIIHLDLDCFYCQVEQKRLGIPRSVPAAVQQWDGLIAINYAARALGVTRHMRVMQAMQFCPELKCIHVQTLGGEPGREGVEGPVNSGLTHPNDRLLQKACLERYRRASAEIIALIRAIIPKAPLEKASIDEVYVDVTGLVEKELEEREDHATSEHAQMDAFAWGSVVEGGPLCPETEYDRRLSVGANIACRLRGAIRDKLDFTSSAGIAHTKMVAKVGSARNKPDQQTIITARGIAALMSDLPLKKLRNFGGKLGEELKVLGCQTAGQVAAIPLKTLQQHFGERAKWILDCVTGQHSEPVTVRDLSKSMLAAKSFVATSDMAALDRWLGILADELSDRMIYDAQINQRIPRLLVLSYRQQGSNAGRSRSCNMPKAPAPGPTAAMLQEAALAMLSKCADAIPCNNLGLTATEFQEAPGDEKGCITSFFQSGPQNNDRQTHKAGSEPDVKAKPGRKSPVKQVKARMKPPTIDRLFKKASTQAQAAPAEAIKARNEGQHIAERDEAQSGAHQPGLTNQARGEESKDDSSCKKDDASPNAETQATAGPSGSDQQQCLARPDISRHSPLAVPQSEPISVGRKVPWSGDRNLCQENAIGHFAHKEVEGPALKKQRNSTVHSTEHSSRRSDATADEQKVAPSEQLKSSNSVPATAGQQSGLNSFSDARVEEANEQQEPSQVHGGQPGKEDLHNQASDTENGQATADDAGRQGNQDVGLEGVDLAEQKKIMREIWMQSQLGNAGVVPKKRPIVSRPDKGPKQPRLTDMFKRNKS